MSDADKSDTKSSAKSDNNCPDNNGSLTSATTPHTTTSLPFSELEQSTITVSGIRKFKVVEGRRKRKLKLKKPTLNYQAE